MEKQQQRSVHLPLRILYIAFLVFSIGYLVFGNFLNAIMYGGIALAFDPFDAKQPFKERPVWQKIWLFLHVSFVFILLTVVIYRKFR